MYAINILREMIQNIDFNERPVSQSHSVGRQLKTTTLEDGMLKRLARHAIQNRIGHGVSIDKNCATPSDALQARG